MLTAPPSSHLNKIVDATRHALQQHKVADSLRDLERRAAQHQPRGFAAAIRHRSANGIAIIAELKKASPSRGLIRPDFDAASLATIMADAGAAALSVLTEPQFFQGSLENLHAASMAVNIPCLRKDFIIDEFQILEARAYGADAILLIVAALSDTELLSLRHAARQMELDVLCEAHDATELARVLALNCDEMNDEKIEMLGVNSRDLKTLSVDLQVAEDLASALPRDCVRIAESGIHTAADLRRLRACGYNGFLIGESLMGHADPSAALRALLAGF